MFNQGTQTEPGLHCRVDYFPMSLKGLLRCFQRGFEGTIPGPWVSEKLPVQSDTCHLLKQWCLFQGAIVESYFRQWLVVVWTCFLWGSTWSPGFAIDVWQKQVTNATLKWISETCQVLQLGHWPGWTRTSTNYWMPSHNHHGVQCQDSIWKTFHLIGSTMFTSA